jgi:hypothetical protein
MDHLQNISKLITEINNRLRRIEERLGNRTADSDWLDCQSVCTMLCISKRTLDHYREQGFLPYSKIGGKVFYRKSDIESFLGHHLRQKEGRP